MSGSPGTAMMARVARAAYKARVVARAAWNFRQLLHMQVKGGDASAQVLDMLRQAWSMHLGERYPLVDAHLSANRGWVFAGNRQISGRAIRPKPVLEIVQRQKGKQAARTVVHDHAFLDLLNQPNLDQTREEFHATLVLQFNTGSRAYILVEPERIEFKTLTNAPMVIMSRIARLTLLEPQRVTPISVPGRRGAAYVYSDPMGAASGQTTYLAPPATYQDREAWKKSPYPFVIRLHLPAPDSWNGMPVTEAAEWAINTLFGLNQLWGNQLKNGLHAGLIFKLMKGNIDDAERFEKAVVLLKKGIGRAGEPMVVPNGLVEIDKSPVSVGDMEFGSLAELARQEVLGVIGASDGLVGIADAYNRANIDGIERIAAIGTVDPINNFFAAAINAWLLPLYSGQSDTTWYELKFASSAQVDETTVAERLRILTGGRPILTQNEAREELGKKKHPDGDSLESVHETFAAPTLDAALAGTDPGANAPAAGGTGDPPKLAPKPAKGTKGISTLGPNTHRNVRGSKRWRIKTGHAMADPDKRAEKYRALDRSRRSAESRLRKALAPVFRAWKDEALSLLKSEGPAALQRGMRDRPLDPAQWTASLSAAYTTWARTFIDQVVERALADVGLSPDDITVAGRKSLERFVEQRAVAMADQIAATQADRTVQALSDAVADGLTTSEILDAVGASFPANSNAAELRTIATTEAAFANGQAVFRAAKTADDLAEEPVDASDTLDPDGDGELASTPSRVGLQWLSLRDNKVRETHAEADGQVVPVGEAFDVGGYQMRFPGDSELCPEIGEWINCRCDAVVVPLEEAD